MGQKSADALIRKLEESAISTLEHIRDKNFKNETVEIDGKRFTNCSFDGCELKYCGGDVEFGPRCSMENSRPQFYGPARRTVLFLRAFGLLSFDPLAEERQGRPRNTSAADD